VSTDIFPSEDGHEQVTELAPPPIRAPSEEAVAAEQRGLEAAMLRMAKDGPISGEYRRELSLKADRYGRAGLALIAVAVICTIALLITTWIATNRYVADLNDADNATETLVLLLARGTAFGAAGTATIVALFLFARACMDQAARFRKRWFSAPVFNEAMQMYLSHAQGTIDTDDVIKLFESWNKVVDSPFANIRMRNKPQNVRIDASRGSLFIGEQAAETVETRTPTQRKRGR
jgi:hypothetical protein